MMQGFENVRGVVWDMDGTLLDTLEDIAGALNMTLRAYGLPEHSPRETLDGIGHGARYLCAWGSGLEGEALDRFAKDYRANAIAQNNPNTRPFEGIVDLLAELKSRGVRLGIYTNKPQQWTEILIAQFFGESVFDMVIGTTAEGLLKPDPEGIYRMCRAWGLDISEVVMVGDSEVDAQTAINAGCGCVCMTWGFGRMDVIRGLGVQMADDAGELGRLLGVAQNTCAQGNCVVK